MSHLRLIAADLDAYEAERFQRDAEAAEASRQARLDLATYYEIAVNKGDHDQVRYIEALAADIDKHNPHGPRLLDEIRGLHQLAAA